MIICKNCCIPLGYKGISFVKIGSYFMCEDCYELVNHPLDREYLKSTAITYINRLKENGLGKTYDAIFAYSGGKDSTAALYSCVREYGLRLLLFVYDNGFKGQKTWANIINVSSDLGLDLHIVRKNKAKQILMDLENGILPCGRCGALKELYPAMAHLFSLDTIITGIECPSKNREVIRNRGTFNQFNFPAAMGWTKKDIEARIVETVWEDPGYNQFDSDCLIPGISMEMLYKDDDFNNHAPILLGLHEQHATEYFAMQVRHGVRDRDEAIAFLSKLALNSKNPVLNISGL